MTVEPSAPRMSVTDGSTVISPDRGVGRVGTGYVLLNVQTRLEPIDSAGLWRTMDACRGRHADGERDQRSEELTSEHQSLMRMSYSVFCMQKKKKTLKLKTKYNNIQ